MQNPFSFNSAFTPNANPSNNPFQPPSKPQSAFSSAFAPPQTAQFSQTFPPVTNQFPAVNAPKFKKERQDKKNDKKDRKENKKKDTRRQNNKGKLVLPSYPPTTFIHRARPISNDNAVLKPLQTPITHFKSYRNQWDSENQSEMLQIEQDYFAGKQQLQSAFDLMNGMRNNERLKMESLGLVDSTSARKNLDEATQFVGSCLQMCPVFERMRRSVENNVYNIEKENNLVNVNRAVKAFCRPAAGNPPPLPSDVRPPSVLISTLKYLANEVIPKLPESHPFLWDRTRSIRQDFTYQNYQGPEALWCFESIARIHLMCLHVMAKAARTEGVEWSQQQELEQLNKCLLTLAEFYSAVEGGFESEASAEMRAYQLMSHFFDAELASATSALPIANRPIVQLAMELRALAQLSIPSFFIRLRQPDVPPLLRCIAEVHFNTLRVKELRMLYNTLHRKARLYSLSRFQMLLGFPNEQEVRAFCRHYGVDVHFEQDLNENVIDLQTYDEQKVRDAQPLAQPFDLDLDLSNVELLKGAPLQELKPRVNEGDAQPPPKNEEAKRILMEKLTARRLEMAKEKERLLKLQQEQQQKKEEEQRSAELQRQKEEEEKQRFQQEKERREEEERKRKEEEYNNRLREQQKEEEKLRTEQQHRAAEELKQKILQKKEQLAVRQQQRQTFIESVGQHILSTVLQQVVNNSSDMLVKSLQLEKDIIRQQFFSHWRRAFNEQMDAKKRRHELMKFNSFKRRRIGEGTETSRMDIEVEDEAEPNHLTADAILTNEELVQKFLDTPSLRTICILADDTTNGQFLQTAFGLNNDSTPPLVVNLPDNTQLCFTKEGPFDAVINGTGLTADENSVDASGASTLNELIDLLELLVVNFSQAQNSFDEMDIEPNEFEHMFGSINWISKITATSGDFM